MTKKIKLSQDCNKDFNNNDTQSLYINSCNTLLECLRKRLESLLIKITKLEMKMNDSQKRTVNRYKNKTQK